MRDELARAAAEAIVNVSNAAIPLRSLATKVFHVTVHEGDLGPRGVAVVMEAFFGEVPTIELEVEIDGVPGDAGFLRAVTEELQRMQYVAINESPMSDDEFLRESGLEWDPLPDPAVQLVGSAAVEAARRLSQAAGHEVEVTATLETATWGTVVIHATPSGYSVERL